MKTRTNIILLAALLLLCGAYWAMVKSETRHKEEVAEAKRIYTFSPGDVTAISIAREGERATVGKRGDGGNWEITEPDGVPANPQVWERVAKYIAELSNERTIDEGPRDLSLYGLKEPRLKITISTKDGKNLALAFGEMDPTQKFRYGQEDGGKVFLVSPDQFAELDRNLDWMRDREVFKKGEKGLTHIEFTPIRESKAPVPEGQKPVVEESVTVIAEKDAQGLWQILAPEQGVADQQMLANLASSLQFAIGRDFVDKPENLKDYKLDPPKARVSVKSGQDGALQTIYLGAFETAKKDNPGVFVMKEGSPSVFVIDADMTTSLPLSGPDAWREKSILTRQGSDIASIKYQAGPQSFLLAKEEKGWKLKEPKEVDTDQAAVSQFIGTLLRMKGSESYQKRIPEFGLDVPAIRLEISYAKEAAPVEVLVGAEVPNRKRRFMTQDSGTVVTVSDEEVALLTVTPKDFMTRSLMSFKASDAREMELTLEGAKYLFTAGEQNWKVKEPAAKVWESQDDMQSLLDTFRNLNAEKVDVETAPDDLSFFGLDKPVLTVTVTIQAADAAAPSVLGPVYIGNVCADDDHFRFARVEGRTQIYRIKQTPVSAVRKALRGVIAE